jgi:hypothetical protein
MFAYEIPGLRFSLPAGGAVAQHRFVSVNSNSAGVQATASTAVVGVSMNEVKADQVLEVADGIVMVEAGGAVAAGAAVYANASGQAVTTVGTGAGAAVAGVAITAATAAGEIITVKM